MIVKVIYLISFLVAFVAITLYLKNNKRGDSLYVMLCLGAAINAIGHFMIACATTLETAIWANRISYLGSIVLPLSLLFVMSRLCHVRLPRIVPNCLLILSLITYILQLTVGYNDWYYKSIELVQADGYSYIIKEYGPAHLMFQFIIILFMIMMVGIMFVSIKNKNKVSSNTINVLLTIGVSIVAVYILQRVFHSIFDYQTLVYSLASVVMLWIYDRIAMYNIDTNVSMAVDRLGEFGYILFDKKFYYVSANGFAKALFPEIDSEWEIDKKVKRTDSFLYTEIVAWLKSREEDRKLIQVRDLFFDVNVHRMSYNNKKNVGYLVEFVNRTDEQNYLNTIENYNSDLKSEVERQTADISHIKDMMVLGMASMVESRDNSTGGHIMRTSKVVHVFSEYLLKHQNDYLMSEDFLRRVEKAAPMHDLGKIAVDDKILRKNGKFTDEEYEIMKSHSAEGAKIVEHILRNVEDDDFVDIAANVAHYHHEKYNGKGYPEGLAGEDIPLEARIMALADVFDALVSVRCYKEAFSYDKAFEIIKNDLGTHFDPVLGKAFIKCRPEIEALYDSVNTES